MPATATAFETIVLHHRPCSFHVYLEDLGIVEPWHSTLLKTCMLHILLFDWSIAIAVIFFL